MKILYELIDEGENGITFYIVKKKYFGKIKGSNLFPKKNTFVLMMQQCLFICLNNKK